MSIYDSPNCGGPIPDLTETQYEALREYIERHQRLRDKLAPYPIPIARVMADDKRATSFKPTTGVVPSGYADHDEYLTDVFGRMGLHTRRMKNNNRFFVARTSFRLDLLPAVATYSDAYHRRCGIFYGYPPDAIELFINSDNVKVTHYDVVRSGIISPEEIAYHVFVPYTHEKSIEKYREIIEMGEATRERIKELSQVWDLPELDEHAEDVHQDYVSVYSGKGGTWNPPMMIHPDADVTEDDVRTLLS